MLDQACQVEVDRTTPSEWSEMLDQFVDANLYQTWAYGAVRWGAKSLSHLVVKRDGEVLGMAQLRIVRPTNFKFGMAYLRWGPVCHKRDRQLEAEAFNCMASALQEEYVYKRRLLLHVLPDAFAGSSRGELFQTAFSKFTHEPAASIDSYRTFLLDLAPSADELRRNLDKKWRNQLARAEKNGLRVTDGNGIEQYRTFCRMYKQMQDRKAFESSVDIEEFGEIQERLPETHRMRILICEQEGIPVAGIVASAIGDSAIYLLGATSDDGLKAKGSYLLQWTLIQWLKQGGFRWYDLGGINPERNPGVYHFKNGLSGKDVSQLGPLVACNSVVSSAVVRAGVAVHRIVRGWKGTLQHA